MSLFSTVVQTLLNNWTALQLAVEHQLGGKQSKEIAAWMVTVVENFFEENDNVLPVEVADYIEEIMNNEFNTLCEDGSLDDLGEGLCKYYKLIKDGNESEVVKELQKYKGSAVHLCKISPNQGDDSPEAEDITEPKILDLETPTKSSKNEPDEDGWVTVSKGKRK